MSDPENEFEDTPTGESTALVLTNDDLRERSEKLDEMQTMFEELAYIQEPKMPCNECAGAGSVDAGSLGNICVKCMGARVINRPFYEPLEQPPFAQLRATITKYGDALADRALAEGHGAKKGLELPPASSVFGKKEYNELYTRGRSEVKVLEAHEAAKQLEAGGADADDEDLKPWT